MSPLPAAPAARLSVVGLAALVAAAVVAAVPVSPAFAVPVVGDAGPEAYVEQSEPTAIGSGVTVSNSGAVSSYGGGYVQFEVTDAETTEFLSLRQAESADTAAGAVSIVGSSIYLGDGVTADIIGGIDPVWDGTSGKTLRVNFTSPFVNPSFEDGTTVGWTTMNQWIDLGSTVIAGWPSQDTSNYDITTQGAAKPTPVNDDVAPAPSGSFGPPVWTTETTGDDAKHGSYSLRLSSSMTTAGECDIVHGPAAYSSTFEAAADDAIYFDWKAFNSGDHGHVFGYILNVATGQQTEVLDTTVSAGDSAWAEVATIIPADGTYRFVFVSGTFDYTCGTKAGATLLIDNVRVYGSKVKAAVVESVVHHLQYENTSDAPGASRTVTVTTADNTAGVDTGSITVAITPVDDAPTLGPVVGPTYTNVDGAQSFADVSGTLLASDPDSVISYGLDGAVADAVTIGGHAYTHSVTGAWGTLHVNESTGRYAFIADDSSLDAQLKSASETYTFSAASGALTDEQEFLVTVTVDLTLPSAPVITGADPGDGRVELEWTAPTWIGGSDITGYRIEESLDGVSWNVIEPDTGTADTAFTVTGLTNGVSVSFRVIAINVVGDGPPSNVADATPRRSANAVRITDIDSTNRTLTISFLPPTDDGGAAITGYEYSLDGGASWHDAGTTGHLVIGDLVNGASYDLMMRAINAAGAGAPGVAIPAEPALEPIPTGPGAPSVSPGISSLIVDGSPEPFVATTAGGTWTVSTSAFTVELEGTNADGGTLALDDQGRLLTMQSGSMMVRGTGFRPGSMVDVWLLAGSHLLGEVPVAGDGTFARSFRIPSGVATGANTVQVNGVSGSGALRSLSTGVVVLAAPATPELASTGADPSGALSLAVACLVLGLPLVALRPSARRRRGLHRAG